MGCTGVRNFHIYYTRLLANLFGSSLKVLMQEILVNSSALGIQLFDKQKFLLYDSHCASVAKWGTPRRKRERKTGKRDLQQFHFGSS